MGVTWKTLLPIKNISVKLLICSVVSFAVSLSLISNFRTHHPHTEAATEKCNMYSA